MVASKRPPRSHLTLELNPVTSNTYVTMPPWPLLRSVDLWKKGCVKSCTFLLRRRCLRMSMHFFHKYLHLSNTPIDLILPGSQTSSIDLRGFAAGKKEKYFSQCSYRPYSMKPMQTVQYRNLGDWQMCHIKCLSTSTPNFG